MRRTACLLPAVALLCFLPTQASAAERPAGPAQSVWVSMPSNFRTTYIGIHGGTVPVSLLASRDCTHMVALVGRTGNDFLRTIRYGSTESVPASVETVQPRVPEGPDSGEQAASGDGSGGQEDLALPRTFSPRFAGNATVLKAGTALGNMPVIYATGSSFADMAGSYDDLLPFGLFEHSPLLEGAVKGPAKAVKKNKSAKRKVPR